MDPDGEAVRRRHITTSGMKALCSRLTCFGIESCRAACGGYGYLLNSALPDLLNNAKQLLTVEGENYMIARQATKGLLRYLVTAAWGAASVVHDQHDELGYLHEALHRVDDLSLGQSKSPKITSPIDFFSADVQLHLYTQWASYRLISLARQLKLDKPCAQMQIDQNLWNEHSCAVVKAAEAHCFLVLVKRFHRAINRLGGEMKNNELWAEFASGNPEGNTARTSSEPLREIRHALKMLCDLFALYWLQEEAVNDLWECGVFTAQPAQLRSTLPSVLLREAVRIRLVGVRKDAVALCDAWGHTDFALNSTIGRWDGDVYRALWDAAQLQQKYSKQHGGCVDDELAARVFRESVLPLQQEARRSKL